LAENIADNAGVAASLYAYRNLRENHTQEEPRLPGLEQLSPEQLFFVNFARTWCQVQTDELNLLSVSLSFFLVYMFNTHPQLIGLH
jgi:predicted metalloendopeptidase